MTEIKRKIHVIGINSFEFKELPKKLQNLFLETVNIAVPDSYFKDIQLWAEKNTKKKKLFLLVKVTKNLLIGLNHKKLM